MRVAPSIALASILLALPAVAQEIPARQRGVSADTAFQVEDLETINLFNGNLSLRIPVGPSYPVGPSLSFTAALTYNSNFWMNEDRQCISDDDPGEIQSYLYTEPEPTNAGLGWRLSFGRLYADGEPLPEDGGYRYVDPAGGQHRFYDRL